MIKSLIVETEVIEKAYREQEFYLDWGIYYDYSPNINSYHLLKSNNKQSAIIKYIGNEKFRVVSPKLTLDKLKPQDVQQTCLIDSLLDPETKVIIVTGCAGSGKSLLSIGYALLRIIEEKNMKLIYSKPAETVQASKFFGSVPGGINDKYAPFMDSFYISAKKIITDQTFLDVLIEKEKIIFKPIEFMRGDAQPLYSKILTPTGWTLMGNIKIGDKVIAHDGTSAKVLGVFPRGKRPVYEIVTNDGLKARACNQHFWYTETISEKKKKTGSIKTTEEIRNSLTYGSKLQNNHSLPRNKAIQFDSHKLSFDPYTLGILIGDGCIKKENISFTSKDQFIIDKVQNCVTEYGCYLKRRNIEYVILSKDGKINRKVGHSVEIKDLSSSNTIKYLNVKEASNYLGLNSKTIRNYCSKNLIKNNKQYRYGSKIKEFVHPLKNIFYYLNLLNKKAWEKFIPKDYIYKASIEDRLSLLQGLMDSDGTVDNQGRAKFCTTSLQLAEDVVELVKSLGGRSKVLSRNRINEESFNKETNKKIITRRINYEFSVSLPSPFNPFKLERKAKKYYEKKGRSLTQTISEINYIGDEEVQCILIDHPDHLYITDDYLVTHNTYDNSILIVDEAQNLPWHGTKTALTRMGTNSKAILLGDTTQKDVRPNEKSGFERLSYSNIFQCSSLTSEIHLINDYRSEISRLISKIDEEIS